MRQAIVTGGTGFIGSWLVGELLRNKVQVTMIVRDKSNITPDLYNNPSINLVESDLLDIDVSDINPDIKYDVFFHLAWGGVSAEHKNDLHVQFNNIPMSINALKLCKKIGCKLFISTGTVAEYSFCNDIMDLNAKQNPNDIYGASKVAVHYYLDVLSRQLGQAFIWTVLPSTYGEGRTDDNILTYTIRTLLAGSRPKYGNLEQLWDFLYVGEVVKALYAIAEKGKPGKVYGIGSGKFEPLRNYIVRVRDLIDPKLELGIGEIEAMSQKTFSSCVNIYDLIKDTGFQPDSDFESTISKTIEWLRNENNRRL